MRKRIDKLFLNLLLALTICFTIPIESKAATVSVDISSSSSAVTKGEKFSITVSVNASETCYSEGTLEYKNTDNNTKYVSVLPEGSPDNGIIHLMFDDDSSSYSCTYEFMALSEGEVTFTFSGRVGTLYEQYDYGFEKKITVSIQEPVPEETPAGWNDTSLASVTTSLGPADLTKEEWHYQVGNEVTQFAVYAQARYGTVSISGDNFSNLKVGENCFIITVTSMSGLKKDYKMYVERAAAQQTGTQTETSTVTETPESSETAEETSSEEEKVLTVKVGGKSLYVVQDFSGITLPDGFTLTQQLIDGGYAAAAKNSAGLILLYLTDEDGKNGAFYIYDPETKDAYPFVSTKQPQAVYIFLKIPETEEEPAGYEKKTIRIDGKEAEVLAPVGSEEEVYLAYVMNEDGEIGWYRYDAQTGAFCRYVSDTDADGEEAAVWKEAYLQEKDAYGQKLDICRVWMLVLGILSVFFAILAAVLLALLLKTRKAKFDRLHSDADEEIAYDPEEEFAKDSEEESLFPDTEDILAQAGLTGQTKPQAQEMKEQPAAEPETAQPAADSAGAVEDGQCEESGQNDDTGEIILDFSSMDNPDDDLEFLDLDNSDYSDKI